MKIVLLIGGVMIAITLMLKILLSLWIYISRGNKRIIGCYWRRDFLTLENRRITGCDDATICAHLNKNQLIMFKAIDGLKGIAFPVLIFLIIANFFVSK